MSDLNYLKNTNKKTDKNKLLEIRGGGIEKTPNGNTIKSVPHKIGKKSATTPRNPLLLKVVQKLVKRHTNPKSISTLRQQSIPNNNVTNFMNYLENKFNNLNFFDRYIIGPYYIHLLLNQTQPRRDTTVINSSYIRNNLCLKFSGSNNGYYLTFFFDDYIIKW